MKGLSGILTRENTVRQYLRVILLMLVSAGVSAQSIGPAELPDAQDSQQTADLLQQYPNHNGGTGKVQPFGANLFRGGFSAEHEDGINPDYIVSPGDQINLRIWGAVEVNNIVTVDHQGNIFVPGVGPVLVGGVPNKNLNTRVTQAVRTVFTDNVSIYTSLNGAQPVAVFVTGYVNNPGRFAGIPSNSLLYFIDRAGGIDAERGSYRKIKVTRNNKVLASVDLYDFIVSGKLPRVQFRDGDTIVIDEKGNTVEVTGDVNIPAIFEFKNHTIEGQRLTDSVHLKPGVTHVGVAGVRGNEPVSVYVPLAEFNTMNIQNGDQVSFRSDIHDKFIVVDVEGSFLGPSRYAVPKNTRLPEILDFIPVDKELTDTAAVSIKRTSIAERQRQSLENSLRRLESKYLTASSQTDAEASIRAQEAKMVGEFVARARQIEPNGRLVVATRKGIADVVLQNGDVITIPRKSESVLLSGEVLVTQAILFEEGTSARDYIDRSGGFSQQADTDRIVLVHMNGEVTTEKNPKVRAGDEIIVLPKVPVKNLQIASVIVDILYKIAVAASVAVQL